MRVDVFLTLEVTHDVVVRDAMDVRVFDGTNANDDVAAVDMATMHERESFIVAITVWTRCGRNTMNKGEVS